MKRWSACYEEAVYDKQFKMAVVKHAQSLDRSVNDIAKELGISGITPRRWINEYDEYGESALPCLNCTPKVKQYDILITIGVFFYAKRSAKQKIYSRV